MNETVSELSYEDAHIFVKNNERNGFRWEGWTIVKWSPGNNGYMQTNGAFRNGRWGYENRYEVTKRGTWRVPAKHATTG
jgi:hypothetical protein